MQRLMFHRSKGASGGRGGRSRRLPPTHAHVAAPALALHWLTMQVPKLGHPPPQVPSLSNLHGWGTHKRMQSLIVEYCSPRGLRHFVFSINEHPPLNRRSQQGTSSSLELDDADDAWQFCWQSLIVGYGVPLIKGLLIHDPTGYVCVQLPSGLQQASHSHIDP